MIIDGEQSIVGDGDAVGIACQILEHLLRSSEGRLGVDDPVVPPRRWMRSSKGTGCLSGLSGPSSVSSRFLQARWRKSTNLPRKRWTSFPALEGRSRRSNPLPVGGFALLHVAPGEYALCPGAQLREDLCTFGVLAPSSELILTNPEPRRAEGSM